MIGLPGSGELWRLAVRDGVWVAVGAVVANVPAGDPYEIAIWRSSDGLAWREVYRHTGTHLGGSVPHAGLTATADGFAVAGGDCTKESCKPFAMHSEDGRRWQRASIPTPGGSSAAVVEVAAAGQGRELVAVGFTPAESALRDVDSVATLWRSGDAGRSWQRVPASHLPAARSLDRVERVGTSMVAHGFDVLPGVGSRDVLWRSGDSGNHWSGIPLPEGVGQEPFQLAHGVRDALVLTGKRSLSEAGLWRSEDLGHWSPARSVPATDGSLLEAEEGLAFIRADSYGNGRLRVWGSVGGGPFARVYDSGPLDHPSVQTVVATDGRVFAYATEGTGGLARFVRLEADGRCAVVRCAAPPARPVTDGLSYRAEPIPVLFGERVFVADGDGYAEVTPARVEESAEEHVHDALFLDRDHGWSVVVNVPQLASWVLRTVDGGRTWETVDHGGFAQHAGTTLRLAAVDPDHAWTVYIVPPSGSAGSIVRTTDAGHTWSDGVKLPISGDVRFTDRLHGFLAADFSPGGRGLYATGDGGLTWEERKVPLPDGVAADRASVGLPRFFGSRGVLAVGIREPTLSRVVFYVSGDSGATWAQAGVAALPPGSWSVQGRVASPDTWWAADGGGKFVATTVDGGRTWAAHRPAGVNGVLGILEARDGMTAVASERNTSGSRLIVTHDGGATWARFMLPGQRPPGPACPSLGPGHLPEKATGVKSVRGDLDGDGRVDRLVLYTLLSGRTVFDRQQHKRVDAAPQGRMRAELAGGPVLDVEYELRSEVKPLSAVDVDGDGRWEVFVRSGRPDFGSVVLLVVGGCQPSPVFFDRQLFYQQQDRGRTEGVECADVDGDGHREIVATETGPTPGQWSYTAYRLAGDYGLPVHSGKGTTPTDARPRELRFGTGVDCPGL